MFSAKAIFTLLLIILMAHLTGLGCSNEPNNNKDSLTSGSQTGGGGSGLPAATITVVAGNSELAAEGRTTVTVMVTDSRGARTEATVYLTSSLGGYFVNGSSTDTGSKTVVGTATGGILITFFEPRNEIFLPTDGTTKSTEITATIPGTSLRGSTFIKII
jgi:hypothetical protein